ncbi:hypothetical protein BKG89_08785 [Rodentibacter caecimuris]|uniref:Uncharacterized protein n=1 Tax=Rodentibacter caecimuris TaxID=1796644 RepID=A0ABX3KW27_9PAST|nr:hypothetical protein BKG89_08785 [Rodentibacter heylii]
MCELLVEGYYPTTYYHQDPVLKNAVDFLAEGKALKGNVDTFKLMLNSLLEREPFLVLANFDDYRKAQQRIEQAYLDQNACYPKYRTVRYF